MVTSQIREWLNLDDDTQSKHVLSRFLLAQLWGVFEECLANQTSKSGGDYEYV